MPDADVRAYETLFSCEILGYQFAVSKRSPQLEARYYELAEGED